MEWLPLRAICFSWPTVVDSRLMLCRTRLRSVRNSNDLIIRRVTVAEVLGSAVFESGSIRASPAGPVASLAQARYPRTTMAPSESFLQAHISEIVQKLTTNEKISLLGAPNWWNTTPIPRLNIPSIRMSDGPNVCCIFNKIKRSFTELSRVSEDRRISSLHRPNACLVQLPWPPHLTHSWLRTSVSF
jgi:hypothetical protein